MNTLGRIGLLGLMLLTAPVCEAGTADIAALTSNLAGSPQLQRSAVSALARLEHAGEPAVPELCRLHRETTDPSLRSDVFQALCAIARSPAEQVLGAALHDPRRRDPAYRALGKYPTGRTVRNRWRTAALQSPDRSERRAGAAWCLIENRDTPRVRRITLAALRDSAGPAPGILDALSRSPHRHAWVAPTLMKLYPSFVHDEQRASIHGALGVTAAGTTWDARARARLAEALDSHSPTSRSGAAAALLRFDLAAHPALRSKLRRLANNDPDPFTRRTLSDVVTELDRRARRGAEKR